MERYDVISLGELLIDFTTAGKSDRGNTIFEANPGGAPCNVLALLANLGWRTAFVGKVGNDQFGMELKSSLSEAGIDNRFLYADEHIPTTLAFVHKLENGDRDFSFYRSPGADTQLSVDELPLENIKNCRIFHYGTLSMTANPAAEATKIAVETAERNACICSFDPNLREVLWASLDQARKAVEYGLAHCDILKISDNEILWLTEEKDFESAVSKIQKQYDISLIFLTMGENGSCLYLKDKKIYAPSFVNDMTIDTTGAGDTFMGAVLHKILTIGIDELIRMSDQDLKQILYFANAAASIVTTRYGALKVMPKLAEIEEKMKQ